MPPHHLSRTLEWRGRTVAWDRLGDGPPLVMLHGTPWSSALWRPIAEALAADHTVHLWDMPGFGASSKEPDHAVDLATQGELFADLLDAWGLDAPRVVAHDVGGAVSLRAHLLHRAHYGALCLVDPVALSPWGSPFFSLVREHADVLALLPAAVHRGAFEAYVRTASHRGLRPEQLAMLVEPWADDAGRAAFYRQIAQAAEADTDEVEPAYGAVSGPVHLVWGAEDTWIPVDRAARMQSLVPHATLTVIPDAGHLVQLDAPERLTAELVRWSGSVLR